MNTWPCAIVVALALALLAGGCTPTVAKPQPAPGLVLGDAAAQTRRVLFAKQLIADTSLPMSRIALLAGFTNVRRFNAAVSNVYKRPPRELRRTSKSRPTRIPHTRPPRLRG